MLVACFTAEAALGRHIAALAFAGSVAVAIADGLPAMRTFTMLAAFAGIVTAAQLTVFSTLAGIMSAGQFVVGRIAHGCAAACFAGDGRHIAALAFTGPMTHIGRIADPVAAVTAFFMGSAKLNAMLTSSTGMIAAAQPSAAASAIRFAARMLAGLIHTMVSAGGGGVLFAFLLAEVAPGRHIAALALARSVAVAVAGGLPAMCTFAVLAAPAGIMPAGEQMFILAVHFLLTAAADDGRSTSTRAMTFHFPAEIGIAAGAFGMLARIGILVTVVAGIVVAPVGIADQRSADITLFRMLYTSFAAAGAFHFRFLVTAFALVIAVLDLAGSFALILLAVTAPFMVVLVIFAAQHTGTMIAVAAIRGLVVATGGLIAPGQLAHFTGGVAAGKAAIVVPAAMLAVMLTIGSAGAVLWLPITELVDDGFVIQTVIALLTGEHAAAHAGRVIGRVALVHIFAAMGAVQIGHGHMGHGHVAVRVGEIHIRLTHAHGGHIALAVHDDHGGIGGRPAASGFRSQRAGEQQAQRQHGDD